MLKDASTDSETFLHSLDALLAWVCEIEELKANQKPPSSEVKVVKAQLQEQKVCYLQHHITSMFCANNLSGLPICAEVRETLKERLLSYTVSSIQS